jgi:hypothetical protein
MWNGQATKAGGDFSAGQNPSALLLQMYLPTGAPFSTLMRANLQTVLGPLRSLREFSAKGPCHEQNKSKI